MSGVVVVSDAVSMIISKSSSPTIIALFRWLRRSESTVRQFIVSLLVLLPVSDTIKQQWTTRIQRKSDDTQWESLQAARAGLLGEATPNHEQHTNHDSLPYIVDVLFQPRIASHAVSVMLVWIILVFGNVILEKGGLMAIDRERTAKKTAVDISPPIDAPLPEVMSASENTVPQMVSPLPSLAPPYQFFHRIQPQDTLGKIAEEYGLDPRVLFWANGLQNGRVFIVGSTLRIPRLPGVLHTIEENETIDSIAGIFSVDPAAITLFRPNRVHTNEDLRVGREIFIPNVIPAYPQAIVNKYGSEAGVATMEAIETVTVLEDETNMRDGPGRAFDKIGVLRSGQRLIPLARYGGWVKLEVAPNEIGWVKGRLLGMSDGLVDGLPIATNVPWPPPRWTWPASGQLTSPFGWRSVPMYMFHNGIDIANDAGTPIYAARYGRVYEAGWCRGFGYCVRIDHGGGVVSIYGHMLKKPYVNVGEIVDLGDLIGLMGSTYDAAGGGYSTGVHLHLTVQVNGKNVDPMKFLP